jgi:hypothetical protein
MPKVVADELVITTSAVERHVTTIFAKLNLNPRASGSPAGAGRTPVSPVWIGQIRRHHPALIRPTGRRPFS